MKTNTFTTVVSSQVELADRFTMDNDAFARHIKHQMLAARSRRGVWGHELELRALHGASFKYWSARSRQMFMDICKLALETKDRKAFVTTFATHLPALEAEFDAFSKKQAGLFTALGASSDMSSFLSLPVRTAVGSVAFRSFDKRELVEYIVGVGQYDADTRFGYDDAKACADWQTVQVEMGALRALFHEHELGAQAWERVYTGMFTKERRAALMEMNTFTTRKNNNEWDAKVAHLSEANQRNISNGEVHHLLSALLKQFDFLAELNTRRLERELERKMGEYNRLYAGSADSQADWELGKDDFLGEELSKGMARLQEEYDELVGFTQTVIDALLSANEVFKPVHGPLAWMHVKKAGEYVKVETQNEARILRQLAWEARIDEQLTIEWERISAERLAAIDDAMQKSYVA